MKSPTHMSISSYALDGKFRYLSVSVPDACPNVVVVSLNRPKKRNAINATMWKEIGLVFSSLGRMGDDCRCVVIRGEGKAFTAGLDISDSSMLMGTSDDGDGSDEMDAPRKGLSFLPKILEMQRCLTAIEECPVPVIAAIHGNCIGAGVDLASCCDIRLAQVGSTFSVREVQLGLAADVGTLQRFPKITGNDSRVRELCYTGETFDHNEALRIGFVSRLCQNVMQDATHLASLIASHSPIAVMGTKRSLVYSRDHTVAEGLEHVASHNALALMTSDIPAAMVAASNKERARFAPIPAISRL
jgi:delta(3,5)-delta(2,4)-dienoyl-CoA isomerase